MSKLGTKYLFKVQIESDSGVTTEQVDFAVSFFVHRHRVLKLEKSELIHVQRGYEQMYYAIVDSAKLGEGLLRVSATIHREVASERVGMMDLVMEGATNIRIGRDSNEVFCHGTVCLLHDQGYRVLVSMVNDIPTSDEKYIYAGVLDDNISGFAQLTPAMLDGASLEKISTLATDDSRRSFGALQAGQKVVVLIPQGTGVKALKDNGLGGKDAFDETILGANGQYQVDWNGVKYDVYGELITATGELYYYVS